MAIDASSPPLISPRWTTLKYHKEQQRLWTSPARFKVVVAGRRSGKTELAKRNLVRCAITTTIADAWFVAAAPVSMQAKRIFWDDLKKLVPPFMIRPTSGHGSGSKLDISESELSIRLLNGATITVMGLDEASRIEGKSLDGIVMDEYASMKPEVWKSNVRPALSTIGRPGWAWFTGVPEGRNHYYKLFREAKNRPNWDAFFWKSEEVLDPEEIVEAKRDMDPLLYRQEYEADFVDFTGRIYYAFSEEKHCERTYYLQGHPLIFMFDFNTSPGTATIGQEQPYTGKKPGILPSLEGTVTVLLDEVYIPEDSKTHKVCEELVRKWAHHPGEVHCYGDATGGSDGTAKVAGSDWDIIKAILYPVFKDRLRFMVRNSNPRERIRVNAMNKRIMRADGVISLIVDPDACPKTVEDFLSVKAKDDGSGEIDKNYDKTLTHLSDGVGYYVAEKWPFEDSSLTISQG